MLDEKESNRHYTGWDHGISDWVQYNSTVLQQGSGSGFAEAVFGEGITFLSGEKDRKNKQVVYTFADSEQREFTVTTYAKHSSFDGLTLPAYHTWIRESYEKSIYVLYQEEIIEDSGFRIRMITPVDWCDPGHSELNDRPVEIVLTSFHEGEEVYEDLRKLAGIM